MCCENPTSSSTSGCSYDVFLSFRGEDTRKTFTDHLYTTLVREGFHTFRDDDDIERGENIESELQKAIEQSRISIIVFSKTYAASRWCLDELLKILHQKKTCSREILPVFYNVDPSEVRKQTGLFGEAFVIHEKKFKTEGTDESKEWMKKVESWRIALREMSGLAGMVLQNQFDGHEAKFIQKIARVVGDKLNSKAISVVPFLIGIDERVKNINLWLQDGAVAVSVLAISGMGGVGKTTIAKFVYNVNKRNFDASSFLANIRERSLEPNGLVNLQKQLLSDIGKEEKVHYVDEGIIKIANAVCRKRLLLVLDDVDEVEQLNAVFSMQHMFSPGSKIIVTTRHACLLNPREVHKLHKVEPFNYKKSLELFSWHAFGQDHPTEDYLKLSKRVVLHCGGLPLALQVLGSSLSGKSISVWESALDKLKAIPDSQLLQKLKVSYDSLQDDHDKDLFLHIACFFVERDRDWTIKILDECCFYTTIGIQNLIDRCLLIVNEKNKLTMHQLLQDMGKEIVRQESPKEPGKRSRLWDHNCSFNVLRGKTGTYTIEGLVLDMHIFQSNNPATTNFGVNNSKEGKSFLSEVGKSIKRRFRRFSRNTAGNPVRNSGTLKFLETEAFSGMHNLKLLQLNYVQIAGSFKKISKEIRWLCWHGFPLSTIPTDFPMENLVALDMCYSNLKQVWTGTKFLKMLKILDLSHSHELVKTPDFSGVPILERLILEDCVSLLEVQESIGRLERLSLLNLKDCKNLKKLPKNICMLEFLETLIISGCSKLKWLETELRTMGSLEVLLADGIAINQPTNGEFKSWHAIMSLWVSKPRRSPKSVSIILPHSLVKLTLAGCNLSCDDFPLDFSELSMLQYLNISENPICSLPESMSDLSELQTLIVDSCKMLTSLTGISNARLTRVSAVECTSLQRISCQSTSSGRLSFACRLSYRLFEIEGHFKLEPMNCVDVEWLKAWGFLNVESMLNVKLQYYNLIAFNLFHVMKLPLQRLYESGVHSYFLPGDMIPSEFIIRSTGSTLSFIVPSPVHYKIRGVVIGTLYTNSNTSLRMSHVLVNALTGTVEIKKKHVKWNHRPINFAIPKLNKLMVWASHWNFGDLLGGGDEVEVSVGSGCFEVKEVGVLLLLERQEEIGAETSSEASAIQETFPSLDIVPGDVSVQDMVYLFGGSVQAVGQKKHLDAGGQYEVNYKLHIYSIDST